MRHEVDVDRGMIVMFAAGCLMFLLTAIGAMRSYSSKLKQFMSDVGGENLATGAASPLRFGTEKAE